MKVFLERENKYVDMQASTVKVLLEKLQLNPTMVLVARNQELVTEDAVLKENDMVKILSVISGG